MLSSQSTTAVPVLVVILLVGFGVMAFSQVPANARLGALLALSLINCFLATLLILPAILSFRGRTAPEQP